MSSSADREEIPPGYKKCRYCLSLYPMIGELYKHMMQSHPERLAYLLEKQLPLDQPVGMRKKPVKQRPPGKEEKISKVKKSTAYLEWRDKANLDGYRVYGTASEAIRWAKGKTKR
jgi:hypothetical protein